MFETIDPLLLCNDGFFYCNKVVVINTCFSKIKDRQKEKNIATKNII